MYQCRRDRNTDGVIFLNADYALNIPVSGSTNKSAYDDSSIYTTQSHARCVHSSKFILEMLIRNNTPSSNPVDVFAMGVLAKHTFMSLHVRVPISIYPCMYNKKREVP